MTDFTLAARIEISVYLPAAVVETPAPEQPAKLTKTQKRRLQKQRAAARQAAEQIVQDIEETTVIGEAFERALASNGAKNPGALA